MIEKLEISNRQQSTLFKSSLKTKISLKSIHFKCIVKTVPENQVRLFKITLVSSYLYHRGIFKKK